MGRFAMTPKAKPPRRSPSLNRIRESRGHRGELQFLNGRWGAHGSRLFLWEVVCEPCDPCHALCSLTLHTLSPVKY